MVGIQMDFLHTSCPSTPHLKEKGRNERVVRIKVTVWVGEVMFQAEEIFQNVCTLFLAQFKILN
jgi:hypothetical protein